MQEERVWICMYECIHEFDRVYVCVHVFVRMNVFSDAYERVLERVV